jgi:hypothetical protein
VTINPTLFRPVTKIHAKYFGLPFYKKLPVVGLSIFLKYQPHKSTSFQRNPAETSGADTEQPRGKKFVSEDALCCGSTFIIVNYRLFQKLKCTLWSRNSFVNEMVNMVVRVFLRNFILDGDQHNCITFHINKRFKSDLLLWIQIFMTFGMMIQFNSIQFNSGLLM